MTENENLLVILMEECDETSQRASKALRFGISEVQIGQDMNNAERIVYEFNDIVGVMELLLEAGLIDKVLDREAIERKKTKVRHYIEYCKKIGTVK